ncbi:MAG: DUF192 domain-containing protein [Chloroflexota bacterium]|nr:DUF192 domain-containing protein [Chloroflexota bacterium]
MVNTSKDTLLADRAGKVDRPVSRGIGLIGKKRLPEGSGLIIQPCNSVVSFFMRFTIDVVFVDADSMVCHVMHSMPTWRTSKIVRKSKLAVELPAGTASATNTAVGDRIHIKEV